MAYEAFWKPPGPSPINTRVKVPMNCSDTSFQNRNMPKILQGMLIMHQPNPPPLLQGILTHGERERGASTVGKGVETKLLTYQTYLTSASGLLSWLLGMQFSIKSLGVLGLLLAHFGFFSFLADEEGMLPFVALWLRGEEFTTPLAFL